LDQGLIYLAIGIGVEVLLWAINPQKAITKRIVGLLGLMLIIYGFSALIVGGAELKRNIPFWGVILIGAVVGGLVLGLISYRDYYPKKSQEPKTIPSENQSILDKDKKQIFAPDTTPIVEKPRQFVIADCTFEIIFVISEHDLEILQTSKEGVEKGFLFANVDIFEKNTPRTKFIQTTIMGEWQGTEGHIYAQEIKDEVTRFSMNERKFIFMNKKPFIGNAQTGMISLVANKEYLIRIRGVISANKKPIVLIPTLAMIKTHEGVVFPAIKFNRMEGQLTEYWQAEFPSVKITQ
jgi:hypothetical protein